MYINTCTYYLYTIYLFVILYLKYILFVCMYYYTSLGISTTNIAIYNMILLCFLLYKIIKHSFMFRVRILKGSLLPPSVSRKAISTKDATHFGREAASNILP